MPCVIKTYIRLLLFLAVLSSFSQIQLEQLIDTTNTKLKIDNDIEAFQPDVKLLNTEIWNRVTAYRFECEFLRLAVELKNNEYWLLEMDGNKRLLARHEHYWFISRVIVNLTLRRSPNWMEYNKLQDKKTADYKYLKLFIHYPIYHFRLKRHPF